LENRPAAYVLQSADGPIALKDLLAIWCGVREIIPQGGFLEPKICGR